MEPYVHAGRWRAQTALGAVCLVLAALGVGFFQLQILRSPAPAARGDGARLQAVPVPAPRGVIVDRTGAVLAEDVAARALSILPASTDSVRATLQRLAPHLGLSDGEIEALLARRSSDPARPLLVTRDVPPDAAAAILAGGAALGGVWLGARPMRRYPAGPAAAHVVGMLGEADPAELRRPEFRASRTGGLIGRVGAELQYDRRLAGIGGLRYVRVDAAGRFLGPVATHPGLAPTAGQSIQLSIDLDLQQHVAALIPSAARAALVALDPSNNGVLALYSSPSFDPNLPARVVVEDVWASLRDDPARPLFNRAIGAAYGPGFPWAATTAAAALRLGILDPAASQPVACRGGMLYGDRYFRCSDPRGHGSLGLSEALQQSCEVYFYQLALQMGLERIVAAGARAGFGRLAGIDLPGENPGALPVARPARERRSEAERVAAALDLATGKGPVEVSALQLARFFAGVVVEAPIPAPRVLMAGPSPSDDAPDLLALGLDPDGREWLKQGLRGAARARGLGHDPRLASWDWSATSGTVSQAGRADHEWFVGIGGEESGPGIVVVLVLERGRHGADAGRVVARTVAHYLARSGDGRVAVGP